MGMGGDAFYLQTDFCFLFFYSYLIQFRKQTELGVTNEEMVSPGSCTAALMATVGSGQQLCPPFGQGSCCRGALGTDDAPGQVPISFTFFESKLWK